MLRRDKSSSHRNCVEWVIIKGAGLPPDFSRILSCHVISHFHAGSYHHVACRVVTELWWPPPEAKPMG